MLLLELASILIYPYFTIYTINAPSSLYENTISRTSFYTNISLLYTLTLLLELAFTLIYPYFTIYTINAPFSLYRTLLLELAFTLIYLYSIP